MKKSKKTALTALLLTSAVSMTSCDWFPDNVQNVYGPPVEISTEPTTEYSTETTTEETVIDEYRPQEEEVQNVYGPPPDMD